MVDDKWSDVYCIHPSLQGSGNSSHYTLFGRPHASVQSLRKKMCFLLHWIGFQVQQAHVLRTTFRDDQEIGACH
jgi:hypothetical protein